MSDAPPRKPARTPVNWLHELRGLVLILLGVLALHSFVAKPFYIPSDSMMPNLLTGDQLIVSKYPYGWSWASPSFHILRPFPGRLFGHLPQRGDIVILTPPGHHDDYIKRVIGLPGDVIALRNGQVILNGRPVRQQVEPQRDLPVDANNSCPPSEFPDALQRGRDGKLHCLVNIVRETLPNGVWYDTIDARSSAADNVAPVRIPPGHLYLLGDNRDNSDDSRFPLDEGGLGGPVPIENIGGRAEFITLSFNGSATWNPLTWWGALRSGRTATSLRPARVAQEPNR